MLSECGDIPAKDCLLDYAASKEKDAIARESYENSALPEKKVAILAALAAAADREEDKIEFMHVDKILSEKNVAYRRSHKRFAMFERHKMEPPDDLSRWSLYPAVPLVVGAGLLAVLVL